MQRPYVVASAAVSLDGCLDDSGPRRLLLSSPEDLAEVDALRAGVDAILVGAGTLRADDPRLLVRSPALREERVATGRPAHPVRITLTATGRLDPDAAFFTAGDAERLVYLPDRAVASAQRRLGTVAKVLGAGDPLSLSTVLADLAGRGVGRLLVEGGAAVHTQFLAAGAVDELRLAVAPVFVADPAAPRLLGPVGLAGRRLRLTETRALGDTAVLHYLCTVGREERRTHNGRCSPDGGDAGDYRPA